MTNVNKYWLVLETLLFPLVGAPKEMNLSRTERLQFNLKELRHIIKFTPEDLVDGIIKDLEIEHLKEKQKDILANPGDSFLYSLYSLKILMEISENVKWSSEAREDLVSQRHKTLIIACLEDAAFFSLKENLHKAFYKDKGSVFERPIDKETNFYSLDFIVHAFSAMVFIQTLHIGKSLEEVHLWYMAGIFSLFLANDSEQYQLQQPQVMNLQEKLKKLWLELSQKLYYRNLMLLYSTLDVNYKKIIHREMLLRLWSPGGFKALLFAMVESQRNEEQSLDEMVATLVAQPTYSTKAQHSLIKQIIIFLQGSFNNKDLIPYMGIGLLSLKKLYDNKIENRDFIRNWVKQQMLRLIELKEDNLVAMEWSEFTNLIALLYQIFCTSSVAGLPSELLIVYLPIFVEFYSQLQTFNNQNALKSQLASLILQILNNRSKADLKNIIEKLTLQTYPQDWYQKHPYIHIRENVLTAQELKLAQSATKSEDEHCAPLTALICILKQSTFNLLTYQIFIIIFQLVPSLIIEDDKSPTSSKAVASNIDLLDSEEDLYNRVLIDFSEKYERKIEIIKALESLAQHQPLKAIIHDNISDLLNALKDILTTYSSCIKQRTLTESHESILMILLILIREIMESDSSNLEDFQLCVLKPLQQLEQDVHNSNLKYQITSLLKVVQQSDKGLSSNYDPKKNQFEEARSLIESKESYQQVEGIEKMIKLLKTKDKFAVSNCHILTALALNTLKSPESYTFLNCVRLFVALVNIEDSDILELLADEYLNEASTMDYRLLIGETILKVSRELGPLCYTHRNVLLNTYMSGCRSPQDEFRFSAFSNLSQMCRILTYQVHNYFQELLHLINCELTSGQYMPAKRAAVMVLSDLLAGMENLFDYEEMLLPIYRLLKFLMTSDKSDEKMRLHASNGLSCLSEKCKELFKTALEERPLEKEIKIMNIHDKPKRSLKNHILEMN